MPTVVTQTVRWLLWFPNVTGAVWWDSITSPHPSTPVSSFSHLLNLLPEDTSPC